ncbi:peroxide stress protein YaaA [Thermophagus sp. OGC60D27]|uniref:peroxide stress protein YaaA n=1 Tax=Thermophagus sp. OGC60D27 TaxID=3458415 RepID=UPI004037F6D4
MLAILSPAKKLDFKKPFPYPNHTPILFPKEASLLAEQLKSYSPTQLMKLMKISNSLAELNAERFFKWQWPFDEKEGRQAIYAFNGEAYNGLQARTLSPEEIDTAQQQLRILSGLYGLLRPLDLILPYRLEMGTKLETPKGKNLYQFWNDKITRQLNEDLKTEGHKALINLASQEYFKALDPDKIEVPIITPIFKEFKNGTYKVVSIYAKKARGRMTRFIIQNRLTDPEDLKAFDLEGYHFNNDLSQGREMVFTRH